MASYFQRALQVAGIYRAAEIIYTIYTGKSLLWIALASVIAAYTADLQQGLTWASFYKWVLNAAVLYAALAFGWLATILVYRKMSPANRLNIPGFSFACDPVVGSSPLQAEAFQAILIFKNTAEFPIGFVVSKIDFTVLNTVSSGPMANTGSTIDPGEQASFFRQLFGFTTRQSSQFLGSSK